MADNYLESRMEAYRSGKLSGPRPSTSRRSGTLSPGLHLTFPSLVVLVLADEASTAEAYLEAFRRGGLNVCLQCREGGAEAVALAQRYGARLYPEETEVPQMLDDIIKTYKKEVAHIVNLGNIHVEGALCPSEAAAGADTRQLARQLLFLLHPDNAALLKNQSLFRLRIGQD